MKMAEQDDELLVMDKYHLTQRLAVGGMGEIFLAEQSGPRNLKRQVILKSLRPEMLDDPELIGAFIDEARVLSSLNHPNIVAIYEVGEWNDTPFIIMEYIEGFHLGKLLKSCVKKDIHVPFPIAARIVRDAALGLDYTHRATDSSGEALNIVHRDISLGNIMLRPDGVVKVVDFGVALAENRDQKTGTGILKGKVAYMSPEQFALKKLDGRSDQYSLGLVFWQLCTRVPVFKDATDIEIMARAAQGMLPKPSEHNPKIPSELEEIIMHMLATNRDQRFESCTHVVNALSDYLSNEANPVNEISVAEFVRPIIQELEVEESELKAKAKEDIRQFVKVFEKSSTKTKRKNPWFYTFMALAGALIVGLVFIPDLIKESNPESQAPKIQLPPPPPAKSMALEPIVPSEEKMRRDNAKKKKAKNRKSRQRQSRPAKKSATINEEKANDNTFGTFTINTEPWAQVWINGKAIGVTPLFQIPMKPGEHTMRLENTDLNIDKTQKIVIKSAENLRLFVELDK
jgi:serine/threonine protein kinase